MKKTILNYGPNDYLEYVPNDYDFNQSLPLLIYLHGAGEYGLRQTSKLLVNEIPKQLEQGMEVPYIVLCPQTASGPKWFKSTYDAFMPILERYNFSSIQINGLSAGGQGCLDWVYFGGVKKFDTIGVVCGKDTRACYDLYAQSKVGIWIGINDTTMPPGSLRTMHSQLLSRNADSKLTEFNAGHNIWSQAYDPYEYWKWLASKISPPVVTDIPVDSIVLRGDKLIAKVGSQEIQITTE